MTATMITMIASAASMGTVWITVIRAARKPAPVTAATEI